MVVHSYEMMTVQPIKQKGSEARKTKTKNKHKYCCGIPWVGGFDDRENPVVMPMLLLLWFDQVRELISI